MVKGRPLKRRGLSPTSVKSPRKTKDPRSYDDMNFSWRVHDGYMDYNHAEFGWANVTILLFLKKIIQALQNYEGLTWHEVKHRRYCHPWGIDEIPKECYARLEERQIDIEELYQIGLGNMRRIIGYKNGSIFYLMWWDAEHKFSPIKAK